MLAVTAAMAKRSHSKVQLQQQKFNNNAGNQLQQHQQKQQSSSRQYCVLSQTQPSHSQTQPNSAKLNHTQPNSAKTQPNSAKLNQTQPHSAKLSQNTAKLNQTGIFLAYSAGTRSASLVSLSSVHHRRSGRSTCAGTLEARLRRRIVPCLRELSIENAGSGYFMTFLFGICGSFQVLSLLQSQQIARDFVTFFFLCCSLSTNSRGFSDFANNTVTLTILFGSYRFV